MENNIKIFDDLFEPQIRQRGIGYYFNDMVKDIKNDGHTYTAKVDGTRIYDVKIVFNDKEDELLDVECNCPYSIDREKYCKHIYALLYSLKGDKIDNRPINKTIYNYNSYRGEVVNVKCPNCGANLKVYNPSENIECVYCNSSFALDIRLTGQAKKLEEIMDKANLYFNGEDYSEAYYEYAKALQLDKDNKWIKFCMDISGRFKNIDNSLALSAYDSLFDDLKELYNEVDEDKKYKLCLSFKNLLVTHANTHLNNPFVNGEFFWRELNAVTNYYDRFINELSLTNKIMKIICNSYSETLKLEIREYDTFSSKSKKPLALIKIKLHQIERTLKKID